MHMTLDMPLIHYYNMHQNAYNLVIGILSHKFNIVHAQFFALSTCKESTVYTAQIM